MLTTRFMKREMLVALMALISSVALAQPRHFGGKHYHNTRHPIALTIVTKPIVTKHISNRLCKQDRLNMALAYLKKSSLLTATQYSKMTGLKKATAKAELDAFAMDTRCPIRVVARGKKRYYALA